MDISSQWQVIEGGDNKYLSQLKEFADGLPMGVINKTLPDVGGTYVAATCSSNYIIVVPYRNLVDSIAADENNKYEVFKCYGGVGKYEFKRYIERNDVLKVAVTMDSLDKLMSWIESTDGWKVLVDEYHTLLDEMDYRADAIDRLMNTIGQFSHYTFLSATPIDNNFEIDFFKSLPHYKVHWNKVMKVNVRKIKSSVLVRGLARLIQKFLNEGLRLPDINGVTQGVEQLYVFLNSPTCIKQILDTLSVSPNEVKVCCATKRENEHILKNYHIEPVTAPNKKLNFFSKTGFQGCNLFTNNGLIIVASDGSRDYTLIDISTTMEQIVGRLRTNDKYKNIFRNTVIHFYSTRNHRMSDSEFETIMKAKEDSANKLISMEKKSLDGGATEEELKETHQKMHLQGDIVSIVNNRIVKNELKRQNFIFKHKLRMMYTDSVTLNDGYDTSDRLVVAQEKEWNDIDIKLARTVSVSYEELLRDYVDNPDDSYHIEYPEFEVFDQYLTKTEMNTFRWNKSRMEEEVKRRRIINRALLNIHKKGWMSSREIIIKLTDEFRRMGRPDIKAKASMVEKCGTKYRKFFGATKDPRKINNKTVKGYKLGMLLLMSEERKLSDCIL